MAQLSVALPTSPAVPLRDQFKPVKAAFIIAMHLGVIAVFWHRGLPAGPEQPGLKRLRYRR
ncbi:MAG: hypothetical protein ABSA59_02680 [Terriglobia bacterium]|jgi:hypothetical protein